MYLRLPVRASGGVTDEKYGGVTHIFDRHQTMLVCVCVRAVEEFVAAIDA
jgi:hypothetical protein